MPVIFKRVGNRAILSVCTQVKTKAGILSLRVVETQKIPNGRLIGVLKISLNGQPLLISTGRVKPDSAGCKCKKTCSSCNMKRNLKVINANLINRQARLIALLFGKLRRELLAFIKNNSRIPNLPCFITIPVCRVTEARVIASCRLSGKSMLDCIREGETFYNECKGDC